MQHRYQEFADLGAEILAISNDDETAVTKAWCDELYPFSLAVDPAGDIARLYGVLHYDEGNQRDVARPSIFIADRDGVVRFSHVGEHAYDRPAIGALLLALGQLR